MVCVVVSAFVSISLLLTTMQVLVDQRAFWADDLGSEQEEAGVVGTELPGKREHGHDLRKLLKRAGRPGCHHRLSFAKAPLFSGDVCCVSPVVGTSAYSLAPALLQTLFRLGVALITVSNQPNVPSTRLCT